MVRLLWGKENSRWVKQDPDSGDEEEEEGEEEDETVKVHMTRGIYDKFEKSVEAQEEEEVKRKQKADAEKKRRIAENRKKSPDYTPPKDKPWKPQPKSRGPRPDRKKVKKEGTTGSKVPTKKRPRRGSTDAEDSGDFQDSQEEEGEAEENK